MKQGRGHYPDCGLLVVSLSPLLCVAILQGKEERLASLAVNPKHSSFLCHGFWGAQESPGTNPEVLMLPLWSFLVGHCTVWGRQATAKMGPSSAVVLTASREQAQG